MRDSLGCALGKDGVSGSELAYMDVIIGSLAIEAGFQLLPRVSSL